MNSTNPGDSAAAVDFDVDTGGMRTGGVALAKKAADIKATIDALAADLTASLDPQWHGQASQASAMARTTLFRQFDALADWLVGYSASVAGPGKPGAAVVDAYQHLLDGLMAAWSVAPIMACASNGQQAFGATHTRSDGLAQAATSTVIAAALAFSDAATKLSTACAKLPGVVDIDNAMGYENGQLIANLPGSVAEEWHQAMHGDGSVGKPGLLGAANSHVSALNGLTQQLFDTAFGLQNLSAAVAAVYSPSPPPRGRGRGSAR